MKAIDVHVVKNDGIVNVGDNIQNNITINNFYECCCAGNHNHSRSVQETSFISATETVPSTSHVNSTDVLSDNIQNHVHSISKVCLICAVQNHGNKVVVQSALNKIVVDQVRRQNSCTDFKLNVQVKSICKTCKEDRLGTTMFYATSQEFECTLSNPAHFLDENIPLELTKVPCQEESARSNLESKSQAIEPALEGNLIHIRINRKVCENGKKVRIKLRFDAQNHVIRRSKSFSDLDSLKRRELVQRSQRSNSLRSMRRSSFTRSTISLSTAISAITIQDQLVDLRDGQPQEEQDDQVQFTSDLSIVEENLSDQVDSEGDEFRLNGFENQKIYATGKFGPLYKVTKDGREHLVKIVTANEENESFLKEARQFCKCRHPYIRPTANILEQDGRSLVFYWFLDGRSLFQAIEDNIIGDYLVYCRIISGIVNGLVYLRRKGIKCQFLSPEKVLLDIHSNPRISGVGKAYFQCSENTDTNYADLHRSLSYLDPSLRNRKESHPNNILWSVGRCIWDMILGRICLKHGQEDLLSTHGIIEHLQEPCNDPKIKFSLFNDKLRKMAYGTGWPKDKEITKSLVVCAVRCMWLDLKERLSLDDLNSAVEAALCELRKKVKFALFETSGNLCLYCLENERGNLQLTCGCVTGCTNCLRDNGELDCPEHGIQFSKIGHPLTYGVIIQGKFHENNLICENDSVAVESLLNDQNIFAIKNFERVKPQTQKDVCNELNRIQTKIQGDKKAKDGEKYQSTLLLYINGHCNDAGSLVLPDGTVLKKKSLSDFIYNINPKVLIVLANGHYSEKLVKSLSQVKSKTKTRFCTSRKFFGMFTHAGKLCGVSHSDISDEHSILVKLMLDILKKNLSEDSSSSEMVRRRYLTSSELISKISERTQERFNKCLIPVDNGGGCIPIAYS